MVSFWRRSGWNSIWFTAGTMLIRGGFDIIEWIWRGKKLLTPMVRKLRCLFCCSRANQVWMRSSSTCSLLSSDLNCAVPGGQWIKHTSTVVYNQCQAWLDCNLWHSTWIRIHFCEEISTLQGKYLLDGFLRKNWSIPYYWCYALIISCVHVS